MREWKPGDVAMVSVDKGQQGFKDIGIVVAPMRGFITGVDGRCHDDDVVSARPLVVIDPENRLQILRLGELIREHSAWTTSAPALNLTAALEAFLNEPPIEVYMHQVALEDGSTKTGLCGKVWRPGGNVVVVGRCPECEEVVSRGWSA